MAEEDKIEEIENVNIPEEEPADMNTDALNPQEEATVKPEEEDISSDGEEISAVKNDDTTKSQEEESSETEKKEEKKKLSFLKGLWGVIKSIFTGRIISVDFIIRYWKTILTALFIMLFYISNRYVCQQSAAHIKKTETEITRERYKSLDMFTRLKKLQREDSIIKNLERFDLKLEFPNKPPYIIIDKNGKE